MRTEALGGCGEEGCEQGKGVGEAILVGDLFRGFEGEVGVGFGMGAPGLEGGEAREGMPGGIDLYCRKVTQIVRELLVMCEVRVEGALTPVGVDVARCANMKCHVGRRKD